MDIPQGFIDCFRRISPGEGKVAPDMAGSWFLIVFGWNNCRTGRTGRQEFFQHSSALSPGPIP